MSISDDFWKYLERRIGHVELRKAKIASYEKTDRSQLNSDQLSTLDHADEVEGSRKELELIKEHYARYLEKRVHSSQSEVTTAYEQGKADALAEFSSNLSLVSDYLSVMSQIYKSGQTIEPGMLSGALFKLLEQFYSGGSEGGQAIASLLAGSEANVDGTSVSFAQLKSGIESHIKADSLSGAAEAPSNSTSSSSAQPGPAAEKSYSSAKPEKKDPAANKNDGAGASQSLRSFSSEKLALGDKADKPARDQGTQENVENFHVVGSSGSRVKNNSKKTINRKRAGRQNGRME